MAQAEPMSAELFVTPSMLKDWWFKEVRKKPVIVHAHEILVDFAVETPEGIVHGKAGDYLMMGIKGELYPCRRDIFEATYDFV